mgnify:CR=1 FL=1
MPTYDYQCDANGRVVEVKHGMSDVMTNWGELCERAGIELGETPADSPVRKLATGGNVVKSSSMGGGDLPPCASGGCSGGMCGLS